MAGMKTRKHDERNPAAVALGALGASKGGKARAAALSPRRRKQIARAAITARWTAYHKRKRKTR